MSRDVPFPEMFDGIIERPTDAPPWPGPIGAWWQRQQLARERSRSFDQAEEKIKARITEVITDLEAFARMAPNLESSHAFAGAAKDLKHGTIFLSAQFQRGVAAWFHDEADSGSTSLEVLDLSTRAFNLVAGRVRTVEQLLSVPEDELWNWRGMGPGTFAQLCRAVDRFRRDAPNAIEQSRRATAKQRRQFADGLRDAMIARQWTFGHMADAAGVRLEDVESALDGEALPLEIENKILAALGRNPVDGDGSPT